MDQKFYTNFMYDKDTYKLVINYFSKMLTSNFLVALTYLSEGACYDYDYLGLEFEYNLENNEKHIRFHDFDEELNVSISVFINSLKLACSIYIEELPNSKDEVYKLFRFICNILI